MSGNYEVFTDKLNQLDQDQSLFESELGDNDKGVQHEELVKLGGIMLKRLHKFAEKGQTFADTLPSDFLPKLIEAIQTYQNLMMPPKVFGGLCPCLKPARSGPEYEKKFLIAKSKMVTTIFVTQAVLIEYKGEQHNMESMHFNEYVNKMNSIFTTLSDIKYQNNSDKVLENARKNLLSATDAVDRFVNYFGDSGGSTEFKAEALRRIKATKDLLAARPVNAEGVQLPIGKRILIKSQSNLQEIMNSAAAIALTKAKENLSSLESLSRMLKKSRDTEISTLNQMEDKMHENNLMDVLHRLREDSEIVHSDTSSKLRDAIKRWTNVKNLAVPRKVAEYEEETDHSSAMQSIPLVGSNPEIDPQKLFKETGKKISNVGKLTGKFTKDAVNHVSGVVNLAATDLVNFAQNVPNNAKNAVSTSATAAKKVGSKAAKVLSGEEASQPPPAASKEKNKFSFDSLLGNDSDTSTQSKSKFGKFNPLDAF